MYIFHNEVIQSSFVHVNAVKFIVSITMTLENKIQQFMKATVFGRQIMHSVLVMSNRFPIDFNNCSICTV